MSNIQTGQGLWAQINNSNTKYYNPLSIKDIAAAFESFAIRLTKSKLNERLDKLIMSEQERVELRNLINFGSEQDRKEVDKVLTIEEEKYN